MNSLTLIQPQPVTPALWSPRCGGAAPLAHRSGVCVWFDPLRLGALPTRHALAVLSLKLDGFGSIHQRHGSEAADELLRIVVMRLSRAVGPDDMVNHLMGGEFACLLSGLPRREQLSQLAWKLLDAMSAPVRVGALRLAVLPCIGIAIWPGDGTTHQALLANAGAAMYRAKQQKSGFAFFEESADVWVEP